MKTALVTGADRGLGAAMVQGLLAKGYKVFAGQFMVSWQELSQLKVQYPEALNIIQLDVSDPQSVKAAAATLEKASGSLDVLINNAGITAHTMYATIREPQNYGDMLNLYNVNTLGAIRMVEAFLPLMDQGTDKRLCFVSSEAGSHERSHRDSWFGYCMSKSALNMAVLIMGETLKTDGYTFRLYHPGWVRSYMSGTKNLQGDLEPDEAAVPALQYFLSANGSVDEERIVLRDYLGNEWPW